MASNLESLDTNLLMRLVLNDIPSQRKKVLKLLNKPDTDFYIDDQAITELAYNIEVSLEETRDIVATCIKQITTLPNIRVNKKLFDAILPTYLSHPSLSFNDCYLCYKTAHMKAEPLWTLDRKLANQSPTAKELK